MGRVIARRPVERHAQQQDQQQPILRPDSLAVEEPLELRVNAHALAVTMRTPGDDVDLAHGFLLTEGVIVAAEQIRTARFCEGKDDHGRQTYNVLDVALAEGVAAPDPGVQRNFYTTSSCGVCGKAALDAVRLATHFPPSADNTPVPTTLLLQATEQLREHQRVFDSTGGTHAAGLLDADGRMLAVREDVGRHNAMDKVLGWGLRQHRLPTAGLILAVSGRASFELVQKAAMAGVSTLVAVSAPSTLAVDLAEEQGMTLAGFARGERMNIYAGAHRLQR